MRSNDCEAKFWLKPPVRVADSHGFDARTLRELLKVVEENVTQCTSQIVKRIYLGRTFANWLNTERKIALTRGLFSMALAQLLP